MKPAPSINAVRFTTQGRIVIPLHLRKKFGIKAGTKVVIKTTPEGILIKPVTRPYIARLRVSLRRNPNEKPFAERWADHKREEHALEDR